MKAFKIYMSLGLLLMGFATSMAQTIGLSIPTLDGVRGQTITIPVNVDSTPQSALSDVAIRIYLSEF